MQQSAWAAKKYNLQNDDSDTSLRRVTVIVQVQGNLKLNPDGKQVTTRPLSVAGELQYDEQLLPASHVANSRKSLRYYRQARAAIEIDKSKFSPQLREDHRLIVAQADGEQCRLFAPLGHLNREELDLIDVQGGSLVVAGLLPGKEVEIGETWQPAEQALAQLLGIDAVNQTDIGVTLAKVDQQLAILEMRGSLSGAVGGINSEIDVHAKLNYHLASRQITWLAMKITEERAIGHAEPGFKLTAGMHMTIGKADAAPQLAGQNLAELPTEADGGALLLELESGEGGFSLLHDRRWRVMMDRSDVTVMRLVDQGDLIAQCNVSPLSELEEGGQLTLEGFQNDIKKAIGDNFGQFIEASQSASESGLRVLRVVAMGTVSELPIQWTYYHFSNDAGRRAACVFTVESKLLERFAETDRTFASSFRFLPRPNPTDVDPPAKSDPEKQQAARPDGEKSALKR